LVFFKSDEGATMITYRSWNEETKKFNYFEDGNYYYFTTNLRGDKVIKIDCGERMEDSNFSWQNAELMLANTEFYVGDILKRELPNKCWEIYEIKVDERGCVYLFGLEKNYSWECNDDMEYYFKKGKVRKNSNLEHKFELDEDYELISDIHRAKSCLSLRIARD